MQNSVWVSERVCASAYDPTDHMTFSSFNQPVEVRWRNIAKKKQDKLSWNAYVHAYQWTSYKAKNILAIYTDIYICVYINVIYSCSNTNQLFFLPYLVCWCTECDQHFTTPLHIYTHMHTQPAPYPCCYYLFNMENWKKNGFKIKTWSQGYFFLGIKPHTLSISLSLFHATLSRWLFSPTPLSLFYCWTFILVQTVKCTILYFIEDKQTCRTSLCLDHDCTCKNELICKLCFTALYG